VVRWVGRVAGRAPLTGWAIIPEIDLPEIFWLNTASENLFVEIPRHAR
jgi:hypothetical protein